MVAELFYHSRLEGGVDSDIHGTHVGAFVTGHVGVRRQQGRTREAVIAALRALADGAEQEGDPCKSATWARLSGKTSSKEQESRYERTERTRLQKFQGKFRSDPAMRAAGTLPASGKQARRS